MRLAPLAIAVCAALPACAPYVDSYGYAYNTPGYSTPGYAAPYAGYGYDAPVAVAPAYGYGYGGYGGYVGGAAVVPVPVPYDRDRRWYGGDRDWNRHYDGGRGAYAGRPANPPSAWNGGERGPRPPSPIQPVAREVVRPPAPPPSGRPAANWSREHVNGNPSLGDTGGR